MTDSKFDKDYPFTDMKFSDMEIHNNGNIYHVSKTIASYFSSTINTACEIYDEEKTDKKQIFTIPDRFMKNSVDYLFTYLPYQPERCINDNEKNYIFLDETFNSRCGSVGLLNILELYEFLGCDITQFKLNIAKNIERYVDDCAYELNMPTYIKIFNIASRIIPVDKYYDVILEYTTDKSVLKMIPHEVYVDYIIRHQ